MDEDVLYIGEDNNLYWDGAAGTSSTTGATAFLNAATITYALKTAAGASVASGTGSLTYITGSDGNYVGAIQSTVTSTLTAGAVYYLEYTLVSSPYNGFRKLKRRAKYRERD
jgi:hypothetical protein